MEYRAIINDNYISHHGTKGMRWGHRKDGGPQGYLGTYPKGNMKKAGAGGGVSKEYLDELEYNSRKNEYFTNGGGGMTDLDKFREDAQRELEEFRKENGKKSKEYEQELEANSKEWFNEFRKKAEEESEEAQKAWKGAVVGQVANSVLFLINAGRGLPGLPSVVASIAYENLKTPLRKLSGALGGTNWFDELGKMHWVDTSEAERERYRKEKESLQ